VDNLPVSSAGLGVSQSHQDQFGVSINNDSSAEIIDFIQYRGCTNFLSNNDMLQSALGSYVILNFAGNPSSHSTETTDLVDSLVAVRAVLVHYAVARLAIDIPQFWGKIDFILGNNAWNDTTRAAVLKSSKVINPELELLRYVDFGGINLLKLALPENWVLLAVPIKNLVLPSNQTLWTAGNKTLPLRSSFHCQASNGRGQPVDVVQFNVSQKGRTVNLIFGAYDPELSGEVIANICWGDRTKCQQVTMDANAKASYLTIDHMYLECGVHFVTVRTANKSGLKTLAQKTVDISCSGDNSHSPIAATLESYPGVLAFEIQFNVAKSGNQFGNIGNQLYLFEGSDSTNTILNETDFSDPNSTTFKTVGVHQFLESSASLNFTVSLSWNAEPLHYIRFTCRSFNNYLYTSVFAQVVQVKAVLVSGEIVSLPFQVHLNDGMYCSRRGDIFEDPQVFSVIELSAVRDGKLMSSISTRPYLLDGIYMEKLPGRFLQQANVGTPPSTSPPSSSPTTNKHRTTHPTKLQGKTPAPTKSLTRRPSKPPTKRHTERPTKAGLNV
jgi:hypothetical protein